MEKHQKSIKELLSDLFLVPDEVQNKELILLAPGA